MFPDDRVENLCVFRKTSEWRKMYTFPIQNFGQKFVFSLVFFQLKTENVSRHFGYVPFYRLWYHFITAIIFYERLL